jgi:hypothetical protein
MPGFLRLGFAPLLRDTLVWALTQAAMGMPAAAMERPNAVGTAELAGSNARLATVRESISRRSAFAAATFGNERGAAGDSVAKHE